MNAPVRRGPNPLTARGIVPKANGQQGSKASLQTASLTGSDGRVIRKTDGLTPKQLGFATDVALGMTLVDAYRANYETENAKLATIYDSASKLMDNPAVAQKIRAILEDRYNRSLIHNVKHVRQHVFDRLMIESMNAKNQASARIRALELLGKVDVVGMFKENIEAKPADQRKPDDIEQEIRTRLAALLGGKVIDN